MSRARVSVCMATYNGERFVAEQIASILPQLHNADELIVIDDASHDRTVDIVQGFQDDRVRLYQHATNQGVVATFEEALRRASGEILFLSDMDDRWAPDKVSQFLKAFESHPQADLVISEVTCIGADGTLQESNRTTRRKFRQNIVANLIENTFQGSALALRRRVLAKVLPLPRGKLFLHDVWIGTRISLVGGGSVYLPEPLLFYRRHGSNVSSPLPLYKKLRLRFELISSHLARLLKRS